MTRREIEHFLSLGFSQGPKRWSTLVKIRTKNFATALKAFSVGLK